MDYNEMPGADIPIALGTPTIVIQNGNGTVTITKCQPQEIVNNG